MNPYLINTLIIVGIVFGVGLIFSLGVGVVNNIRVVNLGLKITKSATQAPEGNTTVKPDDNPWWRGESGK